MRSKTRELKMLELDRLFSTIEELVMLYFPSGAESEINQRLMKKFAALGVNAWLDRANNAIALIPGRNPQKSIGITAHKKYEIGALENVGLMQALLDNEGRVLPIPDAVDLLPESN
jgi:putative aminopeptidase FrvX